MPDGDARQPGGQPHRLHRRQRLIHSALFAECQAQQQRYAGRWMVLCLRRGPDAALRLGVIAGRRLGGAVVRNRAKRRLREVFRLCRPRLTGLYDVILLARSGLDRAQAPEIRDDFLKLARRAGLLSKPE